MVDGTINTEELLEPLLNQLTQDDILSFSSTCKAYRQLLAPWAFRVLRFSSVAVGGSSLSALLLVAEQYANFVEVLEFTAVDLPGEEGEGLDADTTLLPTAAAELLSYLPRFPSLHTLKVRFSIPRYKDAEAAYFHLDSSIDPQPPTMGITDLFTDLYESVTSAFTTECHSVKHHFDECVERVTAQHEDPEYKGPKEDCVEEFFHLQHCVTACAAPKLWKALK
ncbi:hypothetical protein DV735_g1016, partial [Chaetothyriales sp. CBS 134920]